MRKIPEEKELLELLDKTGKDEAWAYLLRKGIVKEYAEPSENGLVMESLADTAERLWKKAVYLMIITGNQDTDDRFWCIMCDVIDYNDRETKTRDRDGTAVGVMEFFMYHARSIHRIVAALIALRRSGE